MDGITFLAPNGLPIAGVLQDGGEDAWPVYWDDPADPAKFADYRGDGPDANDWDTKMVFGHLVWVDEERERWLSRHLIPDGAKPLSDAALTVAKRDVAAVFAAAAATKLRDHIQVCADLAPAATSTHHRRLAVYPVFLHDTETMLGHCERQAEQLRRAWEVAISREQAEGRGVAPASIGGEG